MSSPADDIAPNSVPEHMVVLTGPRQAWWYLTSGAMLGAFLVAIGLTRVQSWGWTGVLAGIALVGAGAYIAYRHYKLLERQGFIDWWLEENAAATRAEADELEQLDAQEADKGG